jgi:tetratricopeptide (TPR) repeat protein
MGRRERPLDPSTGILYEFANGLRELREGAGGPSYGHLARATHYSVATLARAASGRALPTLDVTLAYVAACGGQPDEWRERWREAARRSWSLPGSPDPAGSGAIVPNQLPPLMRDFIGRHGERAALDAVLASADRADGPPVVAIVGGPGSGKTALAVRWAAEVRARFPDGVLFADLRGFDPAQPPVEPGAQLESFLRAFGVGPSDIPYEVAARSALFRSVLADKRVLVLLDNASGVGQVRPMLAGQHGCLTLVTSRETLAGLVARDGAARILVPALPGEDAEALLRRRLTPAQQQGGPALLARMVELCAGLPLALRVAAEHAARYPDDSLEHLVDQLVEERDRLDLLATEDDEHTRLRAVFSWSYRSLNGPERRMFRLLGLDPGADISDRPAAALAQTSARQAKRLLDRLVRANLVETPAPGRYRMHDLLRLYARERVAAEQPGAEGTGALRRLLLCYLHSAAAAGRVLVPKRSSVDLDEAPADVAPLTFADYHAALDWCEAERANLVAATRAAAGLGDHVITWQLPAALAGFLTIKRYWADWIETHRLGLRAAQDAGDPEAEALLHSRLGVAYGYLGRFEDCSASFRRARELQRASGAHPAEAATLLNFGFALWRMDRTAESIAAFEESLPLFRAAGDRHGEGMALNNLGEAYASGGRVEEALSHLDAALVVFRDSGNLYGEGAALDSLAMVYRGQDRADDALRTFHEARAVRHRIGDRHGEARTLRRIGELLVESGDAERGNGLLREALQIFESLNDPQAVALRVLLGQPE